MSEINLEFLLGVMPPAEATLYRVLIQLIPAPGAESTIAASRQIKMAVLAKRTGLSKRWVIELLQRLEEKNLIQTEGGSGTVKWIWLLPLGVPRLGKPFPTELTQKEKTSPEPIPGKAKAQRAAATQPKRRRQEKAQSAKPDTNVQVAPPVEKPVEIPKRRQKAPLPSTPPTDPSPKGPVLAPKVTPPPPTAPGNLAVPAAAVIPPQPAAPAKAVRTAKVIPPAAPGDPAVPATRVIPPRRAAPAKAMQATVVTPPPAPAAPVVQTAVVPPTPTAPARAVRTAVVVPPTVPGNPAVPAARVTPPPILRGTAF